ncbi:MAG: hypothetical protein COV44_03510 [Deltaproteobacteria bacterium CG11_big_fil_rev_8_21_14_0_20_45_16]|nr:MAG: hypothetical protein COV44_03510 [Deltaproteobacteria bacterium CG11_big_fil_rev_8_21_14_0_20_45_16]
MKYAILCYTQVMQNRSGIKPQDVLLLLKLASSRDAHKLNQLQLSRQLHMSQSEISAGLKRAAEARLLIPESNKVMKLNFTDFLIYGLPFVFPAKPGPIDRGIPTSHSAPPLNKKIVSGDNDKYVWPDADGKVTGQTIQPIYSSAPEAAKEDPKLYELLAMVDALRVGRARERTMAREEIKKRLFA